MKNFLGEDVNPREMTFEMHAPCMQIFVDKHWSGHVFPNGFLGGSIYVHHRFGEPIICNIDLLHTLSFREIKAILDAYESSIPAERSTQFAVARLAEDKQITFSQALKYLEEKQVALYYPNVSKPDWAD